MANFVVILEPRGGVKGDDKKILGGPTKPMLQEAAFQYLCTIIGCHDGHPARPNLSQALNVVFSNPRPPGTEGNFNGHKYVYDGKQTRHASAGVADKSSVTLFFYVTQGIAYVFAVGEHEGNTSYRISHFGQPGTEFKMKGLIVLEKKKR